MNLHQLIFTQNACYKAGVKMNPKGIMVHSTGADNPWLKRYVGPDDGLLGQNQYNNHWNQATSRNVCVHAFIGKLADGTIATYQALPWDHRGWHCASGVNGSGNAETVVPTTAASPTCVQTEHEPAAGLVQAQGWNAITRQSRTKP